MISYKKFKKDLIKYHNIYIIKNFERPLINHFKYLNERIVKKKYLKIEITQDSIKEVGLKYLQTTKKLILFKKEWKLNIEAEIFLIATHIKLHAEGGSDG